MRQQRRARVLVRQHAEKSQSEAAEKSQGEAVGQSPPNEPQQQTEGEATAEQ